jgi:hypothetical protein
MLELNRTSTVRYKNGNTNRLVSSVLLAGALLLPARALVAAPLISSFVYGFNTALTNNGSVDSDARGNARGNLNRRGVTDNQRLSIAVSKLDASTTYHLVAFLGNDASSTPVADFTTDAHGSASVAYVKSATPGAHPLPDAVDPISNVRELDVVNTTGDTVLQADITDAHSFSYSVHRAMDNTGFLPGAGGSLVLSGSPHATRVAVVAVGLAPQTSYQLLVNGTSLATKTSDAHGKLSIAGPRTGAPLVLDVRTVELADGSANVILSSTGLGIPGVVSTVGQGGVALGAAANYAVLAGSTVTSINATTLNGDLGVAPGSAVTGFPPGTVNGDLHAGDSAAGLAEAALTVAYNDAKGRTLAPVSVAGNLGGQTLAPGLYKSTGSLEISSGDLVLDAQGNPNGVFIFQIASTLTTTAGRQVTLSGGAKASNVFWQVGSSATLGTTSAFKGTIMADQSITLNTGATLDGRALARIGAVTMDANVITLP